MDGCYQAWKQKEEWRITYKPSGRTPKLNSLSLNLRVDNLPLLLLFIIYIYAYVSYRYDFVYCLNMNILLCYELIWNLMNIILWFHMILWELLMHASSVILLRRLRIRLNLDPKQLSWILFWNIVIWILVSMALWNCEILYGNSELNVSFG